jgi:hypothetical protein
MDDILVWSRMGFEAGDELNVTIDRKERERVAGAGEFFWGVGNFSRYAGDILSEGPIDIIFSIAKNSKGGPLDNSRENRIRWRSYLDSDGRRRSVPPHALVKSAGKDRPHYALICGSKRPLKITAESFDPNAYRTHPNGASANFHPVTKLVRRVALPSGPQEYIQGFRAVLLDWVRLDDPVRWEESEGA